MSKPQGEPPRVMIRKASSQWMMLATWAVLMSLSFPWPNFWLLAHFALIPLALLAIRSPKVGQLALFTWIGGSIWWAGAIWWIGMVTLPGYVGLALYKGIYPMLFCVGLRLIHDRLRYPLAVTVPLVWVATEYLRGIILTGFPWFMIGHSQPTWVIQIADMFGAYGVSFLVAMTSGMICDVLTRPLVRPRGTGWRRMGVPVRVSLPLWFAAIVGSLVYGAYRCGQYDDATTRSLRVAVVQTNVPQSNKTNPTDEQNLKNFARMMELTRRAAIDTAPPGASRPDLIVWPETMSPRPLNDESIRFFEATLLPDYAARYTGYRRELLAFAAEHDVSLIIGAHAMIDWTQTDTGGWRPVHRYNAAYHIRSDGTMTRYDKLHRVPFGEYIPLVDSMPWIKSAAMALTPYDHDYTLRPGTEIVRFAEPVDDGAARYEWRIAAPICFEDVVSYMPRGMVWDGNSKRVDVLVNLSNDGWFVGTSEGWQHEQIARFRCVETRTPMARSVNTGVSSFIDSCGRVIKRVEVDGETQNIEGVAAAYLERDTRVSLFLKVGDAFAATCTWMTGILIGLIVLNKLLLGRMRRAESDL